MTVPHLSIACACGRSASIESPTITDIPTAQEAFVGWGYDDHGFTRCPECLTGETAFGRKEARQDELFAEEGA